MAVWNHKESCLCDRCEKFKKALEEERAARSWLLPVFILGSFVLAFVYWLTSLTGVHKKSHADWSTWESIIGWIGVVAGLSAISLFLAFLNELRDDEDTNNRIKKKIIREEYEERTAEERDRQSREEHEKTRPRQHVTQFYEKHESHLREVYPRDLFTATLRARMPLSQTSEKAWAIAAMIIAELNEIVLQQKAHARNRADGKTRRGSVNPTDV